MPVSRKHHTEKIFNRPRHPTLTACLPIPSVDEKVERLNVIHGGALSHVFPPRCRFSPRCPHVQERWVKEQPGLLELEGGIAALPLSVDRRGGNH